MEALRLGKSGKKVERWQQFLLGLGLYEGVVDGHFGDELAEATRRFQQLRGLKIDGIAGNRTLGTAMTLGLQLVDESEDASEEGPNWPPPPAHLQPLDDAGRGAAFGQFEFEPAPHPKNPEGIRILGTWAKDNLRTVIVPQLRGVIGAPSDGRVTFHAAGLDQLQKLFAAWDQAGLLGLVRSWAGSYNPRFIRGSRSRLSNHAWATAFDINAAWNPLGARPATIGDRGSVRKLVPLANEHGFFWGGHFGSRPDGMHFELAKPG